MDHVVEQLANSPSPALQMQVSKAAGGGAFSPAWVVPSSALKFAPRRLQLPTRIGARYDRISNNCTLLREILPYFHLAFTRSEVVTRKTYDSSDSERKNGPITPPEAR
jgi:hypothetical protein